MHLVTTMDELIGLGAARVMIIVVPNGRNAYFGSFYTNSSVTGGWEDFIAQELVSWIDAKYRTIPRPESRGIAGHSVGGYGAIMLAMKHPDIFSALYALSPWFMEICRGWFEIIEGRGASTDRIHAG